MYVDTSKKSFEHTKTFDSLIISKKMKNLRTHQQSKPNYHHGYMYLQMLSQK